MFFCISKELFKNLGVICLRNILEILPAICNISYSCFAFLWFPQFMYFSFLSHNLEATPISWDIVIINTKNEKRKKNAQQRPNVDFSVYNIHYLALYENHFLTPILDEVSQMPVVPLKVQLASLFLFLMEPRQDGEAQWPDVTWFGLGELDSAVVVLNEKFCLPLSRKCSW